MITILDKCKTSGDLVLLHYYTRGSLRDYSVYGNHITIAGTGVSWTRDKYGYCLQFPGTTGASAMTVADSSSIRLAGGQATFVLLGNWFTQVDNKRILYKRNLTNVNYDIYTAGATSQVWYDGTNTSTIAAPISNRKMLTYTVVSGSKPLFYADGVFAAQGDTAVNLTQPAVQPDLKILGSITGPGPTGTCSMVLIIKRVLSANEISQLYQELTSERFPLRAYSFGSRMEAPKDPPGVTALLKTDFTTKLPDGRLADLSGNGWHGTIKPGYVAVPGMCGNALTAGDTISYIDFGNVIPINGATKLSVISYHYHDVSQGLRFYFNKGTANSNRNDIKSGIDYTAWHIGDQVAVHFETYKSHKRLEAWIFDGDGYATAPNKVKLYTDTIIPELGTNTVTLSALPNTGSQAFEIGRLSWSNIYYAPEELNYLCVYQNALTQAQVNYIYRQIAARNTFSLDLNKVPVSLSNLVGPCEISGTPFKLYNGTWKVSEDTAGKHWFESVATNSSSIYMNSIQAFGTWVFEIYHTIAGEYVIFTCNSPSMASGKTGYAINLSSTTLSFARYDAGGPATIMSSTTSVVVGNAYTFAVTRNSASEFIVYIKSNSNWSKVAATSGTNPVTDATYKTSSYFMCATFTAASAGKFANPRFFQGVLTIDQLEELCP